MKSKKFMLLVFLTSFFFACQEYNKGNHRKEEDIRNTLQQMRIEPRQKEDFVLLVVPILDGCASCVDVIMGYVSSRVNSTDNLVTILTFRSANKLNAKRYISHYFDLQKLKSKSVFLDSLDVAFKEDLIFDKPRLYQVKRGFFEVVDLNPQNVVSELEQLNIN